MNHRYAALWVKSNYSFLEGASHPEELVERAELLGLHALALTDRDGVYGAVRGHLEAQKRNIPIIHGAELTLDHDDADRLVSDSSSQPLHEARPTTAILLAKNRHGWGALTRLISKGRLRCPKGVSRISLRELLETAGDCVALTREPSLLAPLRDAYGDDAFALLTRHRRSGDIPQELALRAAATLAQTPLVAGTEVLYHDPARRPLQDVVTCIRHGCTLSDAGRRIQPNAEHALRSFEEMQTLFAGEEELLERTVEIAERCTFHLGELDYRYPAEHLPDGTSERGWLRRLTFEGARKRYGDAIPGPVHTQLERELELIEELDYGGYFLTMFEIVEFCRKEHILCQGRGSAANSAVCFCLGITAIDPIRMDLLFERFLSRERAEPPDIDLDIEHERREEVIQHVYERYGRRHAAMVANVIRYRVRSALREVGKVVGIPQTELDGLARLFNHWSAEMDEASMRQAGLDPHRPSHRLLNHLVAELLDFPRHLSIHPGGFLLGHEPVDTLVPIEPATMEGRTVIQWDKQDIEDLGLFKVDLLGLGSLSAIHRCFDLLHVHRGVELSIASVPAEDPPTYEMLSSGDTLGVFQVESRAQMAMLPRLRPQTFYDLVIEVALVRPGPIQGDMVHPYLRRRRGEESVTYPHPSLERVLKKTLGVPIFQEQVMKLAILAADYSPGEADQLRRDMAAWRSRGRIEEHRDRLIGRMVGRGIPEEFAERVFAQIRGFGEYGFPESHAASFALLAYVTAYLRCHYPEAYACALLNAQPMGFYSPSTIVEDVKRHGVTVLPIDAQRSRWDCTLERVDPSHSENPAWGIRMGFRYLQGFGERERRALEAQPAPYRDLDHFVRRTRLDRRALVSMAEAGALDSFGIPRRDAIWKVRGLAPHARAPLDLAPDQHRTGFLALRPAEEIAWDYRSSQHSPRGHPMGFLRPQLQQQRIPAAEDFSSYRHGERVRYVGVVICRQRPQTATGVTFMTLEDETGFVNLVLWRDVFERFSLIGKTASLLGVRGTLQIAEGVTHLVGEELFLPELDFHPEAGPRSRDFH